MDVIGKLVIKVVIFEIKMLLDLALLFCHYSCLELVVSVEC